MPDPKDAITILLAEYQALRTEIQTRSGAQSTLMQLTITAFGALAALSFTQYGDRRMLLLIPVISTILGLVWLDHAANISNIGDFIMQRLWPALVAGSEADALPDYEVAVRAYERSPGVLLRLFGLPPLLIFILLPIVAIVVAFDSSSQDWLFWTLVVIDLALLLVFTLIWLPYLDSPRQSVDKK